ncbi:TlpA family protein disulfide reductase [Mucilaginibacter sp. BJC16-A38]|uniref:TlpA family protein disulfide reductase n=1 Tax=Mucilaginibacter phenanthrenivorans TaxID=1234842 RepID=UPI002158030C|nr:TlpA disulfide reductase family protein [Mucilaginibacter phenanthrenivorans]MCR8561063.1 TlpA family protein disulfide reductase [Mucilaginibacter phenanthrenivorans]
MKTFKCLKLLPIYFLPLISFAQAKYGGEFAVDIFLKPKDSVEITGKVLGYKPGQSDNFIKISTYGINGEKKIKSYQLNRDGTYRFSIFQSFGGDIEFGFADALVNLFLNGKEKVIINVDNEKATEGNDYKNAIAVEGQLSAVNYQILAFQSAFYSHKFERKADLSDKTQSDSLYAAKRLERLKEELGFLENYIKQEKIQDTTFINWERNSLTYNAGKDILLYPFFGKLNKSISTDNLLKLIAPIPIVKYSALHNSAYYDFLQMLASDHGIIYSLNPQYNSVLKENGYNLYPLILNAIDDISSGICRELLYYDIYPDNALAARSGNVVWERFNSTVEQKVLKDLLTEKKLQNDAGFKKYSIIDRINHSAIHDTLKHRLADSFVKFKGSNIYVDFWGEWCGPCMQEFPNYKQFISSFSGKPIKFVFFSTYTSIERMLAIKNKFGIDATFVNLSKDEVAVMNNVFEFHSYPSHFLVNKEGIVVNNDSEGVRNESGVKNTSKLVTNLLKL